MVVWCYKRINSMTFSRRSHVVYTIVLITALMAATVGMPLAMILCGQSQGHIFPSMQGHLCTPGVTNAMLHLGAYLAAFAAIVFALWYFVQYCAHSFFARPRAPTAPPLALVRAWKTIRAAGNLKTRQKAISLGIIPQRHPTFA